jgi:arylsulfatase
VFHPKGEGGLAKTATDYPPMQGPASFNLGAVKKQIEMTTKEYPGR